MKPALSRLLTGLGLLSLLGTAGRGDPLNSVAKQLLKGTASLSVKRIAVLSFPYHNGDVSSGSSLVAERLTTLLVERGGAEVVERALLDKALGEIRLGMSGLQDPATTQKLGKMLGAGAIVTGTLIDLDDGNTEVNARLIQTETGSILAAATARVKRTWQDLPRPAPNPAAAEPPEEPVHMSKLIPTHPVRRSLPAAAGYRMPENTAAPREPAAAPSDAVLTLTNDDLVPVNHRGQTDPERIINDFLSDQEPEPPQALHMARRIYHRNPDPQVRGRALLAMGHLLERDGRPAQASRAYEQVLREFPDRPGIESEARRRLEDLGSRP